jgi:GH24 family phage-related lysozyme (muramidase)
MKALEHVDDIRRHEGCVPYLYCDLRGFVTVGIGNLVRSPDHAASLPFAHHDEVPVTTDEKRSAFVTVQDAYQKGLLASAYASLTSIRMNLDACVSLLERRLSEEFFPAITRMFPDCYAWPSPARRATVDMFYSLGIYGFVHGFPMLTWQLQRPVNQGGPDFYACADECHRRKDGEDAANPATWGPRNSWTRDMFLRAIDS